MYAPAIEINFFMTTKGCTKTKTFMWWNTKKVENNYLKSPFEWKNGEILCFQNMPACGRGSIFFKSKSKDAQGGVLQVS